MPKFFTTEEGLRLGGSSLVVSLVSGLKLSVLYLDNLCRSQFPAGLFAIFLCFLMMMMRRRRQRQRMATVTTQGGIPPNIQLGNKPMFSRPWGQATAPPNQVPMSAYDTQGQNHNPYNNPAQYPSNSDYPNQSPLPPPPAYGQDANNHGYYAAVRTFLFFSQCFSVEKRISLLDLPRMRKEGTATNPIQWCASPAILISVNANRSPTPAC